MTAQRRWRPTRWWHWAIIVLAVIVLVAIIQNILATVVGNSAHNDKTVFTTPAALGDDQTPTTWTPLASPAADDIPYATNQDTDLAKCSADCKRYHLQRAYYLRRHGHPRDAKRQRAMAATAWHVSKNSKWRGLGCCWADPKMKDGPSQVPWDGSQTVDSRERSATVVASADNPAVIADSLAAKRAHKWLNVANTARVHGVALYGWEIHRRYNTRNGRISWVSGKIVAAEHVHDWGSFLLGYQTGDPFITGIHGKFENGHRDYVMKADIRFHACKKWELDSLICINAGNPTYHNVIHVHANGTAPRFEIR